MIVVFVLYGRVNLFDSLRKKELFREKFVEESLRV
jgi:hypothetical protein